MGKCLRTGFVLILGLMVPCACGGGGGGGGNGDFALSDIVGSWLGPTASVTVDGEIFLAAGPAGMVVDASGNAVGAGATTLEGTVSLTDASLGTYRLVGTGPSAGLVAMLFLGADKDHLLWATNALVLGAWERDATNFAPPYSDADIRSETWTGLAAEANGNMDPIDPQLILVTVDGAGNFTADTSSTNLEPLTVTEMNKGAFQGDAIDPGPPVETSNVAGLITPDRQFVAIFSCLTGGTFPDDCSWAGLSR